MSVRVAEVYPVGLLSGIGEVPARGIEEWQADTMAPTRITAPRSRPI